MDVNESMSQKRYVDFQNREKTSAQRFKNPTFWTVYYPKQHKVK